MRHAQGNAPGAFGMQTFQGSPNGSDSVRVNFGSAEPPVRFGSGSKFSVRFGSHFEKKSGSVRFDFKISGFGSVRFEIITKAENFSF